jgi:hypothetical protein
MNYLILFISRTARTATHLHASVSGVLSQRPQRTQRAQRPERRQLRVLLSIITEFHCDLLGNPTPEHQCTAGLVLKPQLSSDDPSGLYREFCTHLCTTHLNNKVNCEDSN